MTSKHVDDLGEMALSEAFYEVECEECGGQFRWNFRLDADNPRWTAECCDHRYSISVETVSVTRAPADW